MGIPRRLSSATASIRARGLGVCGSVARHARSSHVGIDRSACTGARTAAATMTSASRRTSGDFVSTDAGVALAPRASHTPGMSR